MSNILDKSNLRQVILDSINQVNHSYIIENFVSTDKQFDNIVINGMGGSALPAELLQETLFQYVADERLYPISIHRSYGKSRHIKDSSLVLAISYSGNTEETLSAYESAIEEGNLVVVLAAGGALIKELRNFISRILLFQILIHIFNHDMLHCIS